MPHFDTSYRAGTFVPPVTSRDSTESSEDDERYTRNYSSRHTRDAIKNRNSRSISPRKRDVRKDRYYDKHSSVDGSPRKATKKRPPPPPIQSKYDREARDNQNNMEEEDTLGLWSQVFFKNRSANEAFDNSTQCASNNSRKVRSLNSSIECSSERDDDNMSLFESKPDRSYSSEEGTFAREEDMVDGASFATFVTHDDDAARDDKHTFVSNDDDNSLDDDETIFDDETVMQDDETVMQDDDDETIFDDETVMQDDDETVMQDDETVMQDDDETVMQDDETVMQDDETFIHDDDTVRYEPMYNEKALENETDFLKSVTLDRDDGTFHDDDTCLRDDETVFSEEEEPIMKPKCIATNVETMPKDDKFTGKDNSHGSHQSKQKAGPKSGMVHIISPSNLHKTNFDFNGQPQFMVNGSNRYKLEHHEDGFTEYLKVGQIGGSASSLETTKTFDSSIRSLGTEETDDFSILHEVAYDENAAIVYHDFGLPYAVLRVQGCFPVPCTEDALSVVVAVKASTVSRTDTYMRRNIWPTWNDSIKLPNRPGCDFVGHVTSVGENVREFKLGDHVAAIGPFLGGNSRYAMVQSNDLIHIPEDVPEDKAAVLIQTYMTAYQCLHRVGDRSISVGDRILVTGANGAVGQAVIELAILAGASLVLGTAGKEHHALIAKSGATPLAKDPDDWLPGWEEEIDIVIDTIGVDSFSSTRAAVRPRSGKLICVGTTALNNDGPGMLGLPVRSVLAVMKAKVFISQCYFYSAFESFERFPAHFREDVRSLMELLEEGRINPRVFRRIPLGGVAKAHDIIENGKRFGNFVCIPWMGSSLIPYSKDEVYTSSKNEAYSNSNVKRKSVKPKPQPFIISGSNYSSKSHKSRKEATNKVEACESKDIASKEATSKELKKKQKKEAKANKMSYKVTFAKDIVPGSSPRNFRPSSNLDNMGVTNAKPSTKLHISPKKMFSKKIKNQTRSFRIKKPFISQPSQNQQHQREHSTEQQKQQPQQPQEQSQDQQEVPHAPKFSSKSAVDNTPKFFAWTATTNGTVYSSIPVGGTSTKTTDKTTDEKKKKSNIFKSWKKQRSKEDKHVDTEPQKIDPTVEDEGGLALDDEDYIDKKYYGALEVKIRATSSEIKKAYYKLARLYHPDKAGDDAAAADKFQLISEAYRVLSDADLRKKYDVESLEVFGSDDASIFPAESAPEKTSFNWNNRGFCSCCS